MLHILAYNTNINNGQMSSDGEKKRDKSIRNICEETP